MNDFLSAITDANALPADAIFRTVGVKGCTYAVFALPYVQLSRPSDGFAFIDSYYVTSNRAYFTRKKLAASLEAAGFSVVDCPYPYKHLAAASGLGVPLRSTLIASREYGTRMALEIIGVKGSYAREIDESVLLRHPEPSARCRECGACAAACPQGCFDSGGFETEKCVRRMQETTVFPDEKSAAAMGLNLWGCDICQRVCPFNAEQGTREPSENEREMYRLENLFAAFSAGKKGCEPYRDMLGANYLRPAKLLALTLNAMANTESPEKYAVFAQQCLNHPDERVREAAKKLKKLSKT